MSASTTATRRKAIDDATAQAQQQAIARREAQAKLAESAFAHAASQIDAWLRANAGPDGRVPPEALGAFDLFVDQVLRNLQSEWSQALSEGLAESASLAGRVFETGVDSIVQHTVQQLHDFIGADGLQLSDRIWRVNQATRSSIVDTIRNAILRGASADNAARELLAQGRPVPSDLALPIAAARDNKLADSVADRLLRGQGNPLRNAVRVMRTEINRSFTESFVASAFTHPDIAAVKFNLSPLHPRTDICDFYASANLHGLGAGVYPQNNHPYPAHPETLSFLTVVFVHEITDADRQGKQSPFDWLGKQDAATQDGVLGQNKGAAFRAGDLLPGELLAPWNQVQTRLQGPTP